MKYRLFAVFEKEIVRQCEFSLASVSENSLGEETHKDWAGSVGTPWTAEQLGGAPGGSGSRTS